jgi:hypothetical protein
MDSQHEPTQRHTGWGESAPPGQPDATEPDGPRRRWSPRRIAVATLVAVGIAGAGTGVVYAAGGSSDTNTPTASGQAGGPPGGGQAGGGAAGGPGGLTNALHGEYVVSDANGTYTTQVMQNGEVTAISASSVTAKSDDGYTRTYTIDADTVTGNDSSDLSGIETGDEVTIVASVSGSTAAADSVSEAGTGTAMGQAPPDQAQGGQ